MLEHHRVVGNLERLHEDEDAKKCDSVDGKGYYIPGIQTARSDAWSLLCVSQALHSKSTLGLFVLPATKYTPHQTKILPP